MLLKKGNFPLTLSRPLEYSSEETLPVSHALCLFIVSICSFTVISAKNFTPNLIHNYPLTVTTLA